ncbi:isoprenylcysteine carboxylmethyltransferase family protein [Catellatospora sp. IY07-71]|uniref:methyltransferase family protein n=1 Tax=Catellatospora sp. IY07-71 TaxID=2728827 RepID=UPI001BB41DC7|nr:isoprenylcysteine carboxylmethyltransferase family protein [Catellatospora sp. IY07-71]
MTAAWFALTANLTGAVYAFGVRSYLAWRATRDTGMRLGTQPPGSLAWWARVLFVGALALLLAAPVAALAGLPALAVATAVTVTGAVLTAAGTVMVVLAQLTMGSSWRVGVDPAERTDLVVGGLFRFCRNPIFTAMGMTAAGTLLLVPNLVSAAGLVALLVGVQLQVRVVEEPYLLGAHGAAYRRYAARTGRFLPLVGRLKTAALGEA